MQLPVALSPLTARVVTGAPRAATVLAAFPTALYLRVEGCAGVAGVLPVVTADALLLPTAARLGLLSEDVRWPVGPGDVVEVGAGRIDGPGLEVRAVREWHPARVGVGLPVPPPAVAESLPEGGELGDLCVEVAGAALEGRPVGPLVARLVGAGGGLTPSGDDALCGVMLALRAWAPLGQPQAAVAVAVRQAQRHTTGLSASLLLAAADGYAVPQTVALVHALSVPGVADLPAALRAVLDIGHTSGRDLVAGLSGALRALHPIRECSSSHRECTTSHRECSTSDRECTPPRRPPRPHLGRNDPCLTMSSFAPVPTTTR